MAANLDEQERLGLTDAELSQAALRIRKAMRRSVEGAVDVGRELLTVKERLPRGEFLGWVETTCGISARTAENAMNAARLAERLGPRFATIANANVGAVYELAARSTPSNLIEEFASGDVPLTLEAIRARKRRGDENRRETSAAAKVALAIITSDEMGPSALAEAIWTRVGTDGAAVIREFVERIEAAIPILERWSAEDEGESASPWAEALGQLLSAVQGGAS
jgi:DUF3102 family protein